MEEIYYKSNIIVEIIFAGIMTVFVFLFLFLSVPKDPLLKNYRTCRKYLADAYLVMAISRILNLYISSSDKAIDVTIACNIVLITASLQTLFIPYAIVSIVNASCIKFKWVVLEFVFILFLSVLLLASLLSGHLHLFHSVIFWFFCIYYCIQLARAARLIAPESKWAKERMDNYFSGQESDYLSWIRKIGYISISSGFVALLPIFFPSFTTVFVINNYCFLIYPVIGLLFLNYIFEFQLVTPVIPDNNEMYASISTLSMVELEQAVENWIKRKKYLLFGITINDIATELGTNRTYISTYINNDMGMNFNTWINKLKIEEAKQLLLLHPDLSIVAVSEMVGYNDPSSFSRNFTKIVEQSPLVWRKTKLSKV